MSERIKTAALVAAILFAVGSLLYLGFRSNEALPRLSRPDVDGMLRAYAGARSADEALEAREKILALGRVGSDRLRAIARDASWTSSHRCVAIRLLLANPDATFDLLGLIDDPDTDVRMAARETVRGCMAGLAASRDPRSDTEARLLRRWLEIHGDEGYGALEFRSSPREPADPPDTSLSPVEIFDRWSRLSSYSTSSPYYRDLRAHGSAATAALIQVAASTDSVVRRSRAYIVLGMLGDSIATRFLEEKLREARDRTEIGALQGALHTANLLSRR